MNKGTTSLNELTLVYSGKDGTNQEFFVQHGLTIGRIQSNTICIDDSTVERIHARVVREAEGTPVLVCQTEHAKIITSSGQTVESILLEQGVSFKIGSTLISCQRKEIRPAVVLANQAWEVRCPFCHQAISTEKTDYITCDSCRKSLMYYSPPEDKKFTGWLPTELGNYRIISFVGMGGMSIVLHGVHKENFYPVAIKLLREEIVGVSKARMDSEASILKSLDHKRIVKFKDYGEDGHLIWLAMEWLDGSSLLEFIKKRQDEKKPLNINEIQKTIIPVVEGFEYLHNKGVIHRDLKPSNIMVTKNAGVKIADFGIAKASGGQTSILTQTGVVAGKKHICLPNS